MCDSNKSNIYSEDLLIVMTVMTNRMCFSSSTRYVLYDFTTRSAPRRTHVKTSMLRGVCQALCRPEAALYVNQSGKGAWALIFPPLVSLEHPWLYRSFGWCVLVLCAGCLGVP
jgi:hypothetical protein